MTSFIDSLLKDSKDGQQEQIRSRLRVAVTEGLLEQMRRLDMTKQQLAERMGVSRSAVTQALSHRNLSLNTLADMADALNVVATINFIDRNATSELNTLSAKPSVLTIPTTECSLRGDYFVVAATTPKSSRGRTAVNRYVMTNIPSSKLNSTVGRTIVRRFMSMNNPQVGIRSDECHE